MASLQLYSRLAPESGSLVAYSLPKGWVRVTVKRVSGAYALEVSPVELQPDPAHRYHLIYRPNAWTNDDITVELSPKGFLTRVHTIIEDETVDVVTKLTELGVTSAAFAAPPVPKVSSRSAGGDMLLHSALIDPFDAEQLTAYNAILASLEPGLKLEAVYRNSAQQAAVADPARHAEVPGIFCRPPAAAQLRLLDGGQLLANHTYQTPSPDEIHFVTLPGASLVRTDVQVKFSDSGYPVFIQVRKPSTALAIPDGLLQVAKQIISLPSQLFNFRIQLNSSRANAMQAQAGTDAQIRVLEDSLRQLAQAQAPAAPPAAAVASRGPVGSSGGAHTAAQGSSTQGGTQGGGSVSNADVELLRQQMDTLLKRVNKYLEQQEK
jgi:hypothetical protein